MTILMLGDAHKPENYFSQQQPKIADLKAVIPENYLRTYGAVSVDEEDSR
jgi:hypothetical protein